MFLISELNKLFVSFAVASYPTFALIVVYQPDLVTALGMAGFTKQLYSLNRATCVEQPGHYTVQQLSNRKPAARG